MNSKPPPAIHKANNERIDISDLDDETKLHVDEIEEDQIIILNGHIFALLRLYDHLTFPFINCSSSVYYICAVNVG